MRHLNGTACHEKVRVEPIYRNGRCWFFAGSDDRLPLSLLRLANKLESVLEHITDAELTIRYTLSVTRDAITVTDVGTLYEDLLTLDAREVSVKAVQGRTTAVITTTDDVVCNAAEELLEQAVA